MLASHIMRGWWPPPLGTAQGRHSYNTYDWLDNDAYIIRYVVCEVGFLHVLNE